MSCCPPMPAGSEPRAFVPRLFTPSDAAVRPATAVIPGGMGLLGTDNPGIRLDGEAPLRRARVRSFAIMQDSVSNADFAAFVEDTGYKTEAEHHGWSFVFWRQVPDYVGDTQAVVGASWWRRVDGASWRCITGPQCALIDQLTDHPVVHVSWNDAVAYCSWLGGRLPTELEWEHAARGGLQDARFPWGDTEPDDEENFLCNIWQGDFPQKNTVKDGYQTTAPIMSFDPNGYGLYNMVGNVWDWTADTYRAAAHRHHVTDHKHLPTYQLAHQLAHQLNKVAKGGSFLCHRSYCYRYRIAARIGNTPDSTTTHMGFRVVWDE